MQVVAISLWGDKQLFDVGVLRNCELYPEFFPEWDVRIYCPAGYNPNLVDQIKKRGGQVVYVHPGDFLGSFWRFLAADDPSVSRVIFRDADSRPSKREAILVQDWVDSKKRFHIVRDHPAHFTQIMAGMWGCVGSSGLNFTSRIRQLALIKPRPHLFLKYGFDQYYLAKEIYPLIRSDSHVHDEFFDNTQNLPLREGLEYVGQRVHESEERDRTHDKELFAWELLKTKNHLFKLLQSRTPYSGWLGNPPFLQGSQK